MTSLAAKLQDDASSAAHYALLMNIRIQAWWRCMPAPQERGGVLMLG
jgi:hypothetical protein